MSVEGLFDTPYIFTSAFMGFLGAYACIHFCLPSSLAQE